MKYWLNNSRQIGAAAQMCKVKLNNFGCTRKITHLPERELEPYTPVLSGYARSSSYSRNLHDKSATKIGNNLWSGLQYFELKPDKTWWNINPFNLTNHRWAIYIATCWNDPNIGSFWWYRTSVVVMELDCWENKTKGLKLHRKTIPKAPSWLD